MEERTDADTVSKSELIERLGATPPVDKKQDCPKCRTGTMVNIYHNFDGNRFRCDNCNYEVFQRDMFDYMF